MKPAELLHHISQWKLDARNEDMTKLYYQTAQFDAVQTGKSFIVVGRKGSGKTALGEHLISTSGSRNSLKLSLKDFPLKQFAEFKDSRFFDASQYVPIWRYTILSSICWLMSRDPNLDYGTRRELGQYFKGDLRAGLGRLLQEWTSSEFGISVLGLGGNIKRHPNELRELSWQEAANSLETYIGARIKNSKYVLVFDELDEHYPVHSTEHGGEASRILAGLVKACYGIRSSQISRYVSNVVLVRDDIYDAIQDPDKNKWTDFESYLRWTVGQLYQLIAHRMSVISGTEADPRDPDTLFAHIIRKSRFRPGAIISPFEAVIEQTLQRPRDVVKFLQLAGDEATQRQLERIESGSYYQAETRYSAYLRQEIKDEIFQVFSGLDEIVEIFSKHNSSQISFEDFIKEIARVEKCAKDPNAALKLLLYFSVVGVVMELNARPIFRYTDQNVKAAKGFQILLHFGLWRTAGINR
jgi:hypothetical protein